MPKRINSNLEISTEVTFGFTAYRFLQIKVGGLGVSWSMKRLDSE